MWNSMLKDVNLFGEVKNFAKHTHTHTYLARNTEKNSIFKRLSTLFSSESLNKTYTDIYHGNSISTICRNISSCLNYPQSRRLRVFVFLFRALRHFQLSTFNFQLK